MYYDAELKLLINTFKKCRINIMVIDKKTATEDFFVDELFEWFKPYENYSNYYELLLKKLTSNIIYRFSDQFKRNYIFLKLPKENNNSILSIGPYLKRRLEDSEIFEMAESFKLTSNLTDSFFYYFRSLPIIEENNHLFTLLDSFAEIIWENKKITEFEDVESDFFNIALKNSSKAETEVSEAAFKMETMEKRYRFENEMMEAISKGQTNKIKTYFSSVKGVSFEKRLADSLREFKNYSIIMNTLFRKSAEKGGVHPIYLDSVSSDFAIKIEQIASVKEGEKLTHEILETYCNLVRHHSTERYSSIVEKAVTLINYDLTTNLTLSSLSKILNVNSSYLSDRFKKETGETLTDYVNKKRIKHAKHLLKTTKLQVQTISQYCGIFDLNYFSKLFKKYVGMTPKAYRESKLLKS